MRAILHVAAYAAHDDTHLKECQLLSRICLNVGESSIFGCDVDAYKLQVDRQRTKQSNTTTWQLCTFLSDECISSY
jgi:hypothetical protein